MKRFLGLVCLIYSALIIYIIYNDLLKNFLAPNMQIYIKITIVPLIIMGLVMLFNKDISYKFKISDLVLILPIVMLILAGDARLSTSLASNKIMKVDTQREVHQEVSEEKIEVPQKEYDFTKVDFDVVDASYVDISNYLTFAPNAKKYIGKTIRVKGFILNDKSIIPNNYKAIGKYNITCCAADALFVGFYIKDNGNLKDNTWYEVEGVLQSAIDIENKDTLAIEIINIKEINEKDEEQYVYPCYSYDDGLCKELEKYDLVY